MAALEGGFPNAEVEVEQVAPFTSTKSSSKVVQLKAAVVSTAHRAWDAASYYINFEFLNLPRWLSLSFCLLLVLGLGLTVGLTAKPVIDNVTLGVEFGGGYSITYACVQKDGGPAVTPQTVQQQAEQMYKITSKYGQPNAQVTTLLPNKINVILPGVSNNEQISPILDAFTALPLGMEARSAISMSGSLGRHDLNKTLLAAGVALGIVWSCLILRYRAAGLLGFGLCIVFLWLHLIFFNASNYALSDAAIVAVVLNIGLSADAHVIAFERVREDLHALPYGAPRNAGLAALRHALRVALVTVLEANISTLLAMVVLYGVGVGATVEFAFTVIISVCASIIINVLLARILLNLAWNAQLISTGLFFGDKGPAYDAEVEKAAWEGCIPRWYWRPIRSFKLDYVRFWWIGAFATIVVIITGTVFLCTRGLNWGVDYTAGTVSTMRIPPPYDYTCNDVIKYAEKKSNTTISRCSMDSEGRVELRFKDAVDPQKLKNIVQRIMIYLGGPIVYSQYTIDNSLAVSQSQRAILAMSVAAVVTCAFLLLRFGPAFSASGLLCMASAAIFTICCFAMGGYEVNLPMVSAVLTVFSYAINDCVVVFDRIRYEKAKPPPANTPELLRATVNRAVGLVIIRSLLTLAVVLVCSICLVAMGPLGLHSFGLGITFGLLNATYTTILICAPFWYFVLMLAMKWHARRNAKLEAPLPLSRPEGSEASKSAKLSSFHGSASSNSRNMDVDA